MVAIKAASISKNQILNLLNDFFADFQTWCSQSKAPTKSDLEKYLGANFQLTTNERIAAKNSSEYLKRIELFRNKYSQLEIVGPLEEPLLFDNKLICQYNIHLRYRDNSKSSEVCVMAIATIENNKFARWQQVSHEKVPSHWDT